MPTLKKQNKKLLQHEQMDQERQSHLNRLSQTLLERRKHAHLSMERLADSSGVSRSMISKIERAEAVPSTSVLAKLAAALGTTVADLLAEPVEAEVVVLRHRLQPIIIDGESGFSRRCISPILPGRGVDWVLNTLPPNTYTGDVASHARGTEEYIYVLSGQLDARIGDQNYQLKAGDSVYFQAYAGHQFHNAGHEDCQYFLVIDSNSLRR